MDQKLSPSSAVLYRPRLDSLSDPISRGKDAIAEAANGAAKTAGSDLQAIRDDLNSLKDTLSRFMSQASDEALKSARQVTSNVAGQVSDVASDLANRGSQLASSAGDQAKTFANELEEHGPSQSPRCAGGRGSRRRIDRRHGTAKLMLFKILKLFGLDVPAKVAAAKSMIEQRVEEVTDYAKQVTQTAAVIAALSAVAGVLVAMAVGVGLFALYRAVAESYGVNAGLGVVAGILIVAALILLLIARTKGQSLPNRHIFEPLRPDSLSAAPAVAAPSLAHAPSPASFEGVPAVSAGDLIEPLAFLLGRYLKYPALGHPVLDELVGNLRNTARGTANEAFERAANLVRYGDRGQLFMLLGGAAVAGWVLARQSPDERLNDATPAR